MVKTRPHRKRCSLLWAYLLIWLCATISNGNAHSFAEIPQVMTHEQPNAFVEFDPNNALRGKFVLNFQSNSTQWASPATELDMEQRDLLGTLLVSYTVTEDAAHFRAEDKFNDDESNVFNILDKPAAVQPCREAQVGVASSCAYTVSVGCKVIPTPMHVTFLTRMVTRVVPNLRWLRFEFSGSFTCLPVGDEETLVSIVELSDSVDGQQAFAQLPAQMGQRNERPDNNRAAFAPHEHHKTHAEVVIGDPLHDHDTPSSQSHETHRATRKTKLKVPKPTRRLSSVIPIVFGPDYRKGNPYQTLLYDELDHAFVINPGFIETAISLMQQKTWVGLSVDDTIYHLHWLTPLLDAVDVSISQLQHFVSLGGRLIWTVHNEKPHENTNTTDRQRLVQEIMRLAFLIHVHHEVVPDIVSQSFTIPSSKLVVAYHGTFHGAYQDTISQSQARNRLGLKESHRVFLFIGQIRHYKGLPQLLDAFDKVSSEHPNVRLVIAGAPKVNVSAVQRMTELAGSRGAVQWHLSTIADDDMQVFLRAADFVVLPYRNILTSGVLHLAQAFDKPVIAPRLGTLPALVQHGHQGLLYSSSDASGLYNSIVQATQMPPNEIITMQNNVLVKDDLYQWPVVRRPLFNRILLETMGRMQQSSGIGKADAQARRLLSRGVYVRRSSQQCLTVHNGTILTFHNMDTLQDACRYISLLSRAPGHNMQTIFAVSNDGDAFSFVAMAEAFPRINVIQGEPMLGQQNAVSLAIAIARDTAGCEFLDFSVRHFSDSTRVVEEKDATSTPDNSQDTLPPSATERSMDGTRHSRSTLMNESFAPYRDPLRAHASQSETPKLDIYGTVAVVRGYQQFKVDLETGNLLDFAPKYDSTLSALGRLLQSMHTINGAKPSFVDVGCSNGLLSVAALNSRVASRAVCLDHDEDTCQLVQRLSQSSSSSHSCLGEKLMSRRFIVGTNVASTFRSDVAAALNVIHWLYSATASFGSLDAVVEYLSRFTSNALLVNWIGRDDPAVQILRHVDMNPQVIYASYCLENFLVALYRHFEYVEQVASIDSRPVYLATNPIQNTQLLSLTGESSSVNISSNRVSVHKQTTEFLEYDVFNREILAIEMVRAHTPDAAVTHVIVASNETQQAVLAYAGEPVTTTTLPLDWRSQAFEIDMALGAANICHNDLMVMKDASSDGVVCRNILVHDGRLTLIDFQWASTCDGDWTLGGQVGNFMKPWGLYNYTTVQALEYVRTGIKTPKTKYTPPAEGSAQKQNDRYFHESVRSVLNKTSTREANIGMQEVYIHRARISSTARIAIILVYCDSSSREATLESIQQFAKSESAPLFHMHVVSNGYDPSRFAEMISIFPNATHIQTHKNLGNAGGRNNALVVVQQQDVFDYVWIIDSDIRLPRESISQLIFEADSHPTFSIFGITIFADSMLESVQFAGGVVIGTESGLHVHPIRHLSSNRPCDTEYVTSSCLFFRTSLLHDVGLLPEQYVMHFDDVNFCLRARRLKHKMIMFPSIQAHRLQHHTDTNDNALSLETSLYYLTRNLILLCREFLPEHLAETYSELSAATIQQELKLIHNVRTLPMGSHRFAFIDNMARLDAFRGVTGLVNTARLTQTETGGNEHDDQ